MWMLCTSSDPLERIVIPRPQRRQEMKGETKDEAIKRLERENAAMLSALKNANENDMVIRLLIAAGHVDEDKVEKARELARRV